MLRKLLTATLFALGCAISLYAEAVDVAPPPRLVGEEKKPEAAPVKGKLGERLKGLKNRIGGKIDLEKLKDKLNPEQLKQLKERLDKAGIDVEKLKELRDKLKKDNPPKE